MNPILIIALVIGSTAVFYYIQKWIRFPPAGLFVSFHPRNLSDPNSWRNAYGRGLPKHPEKTADGFAITLVPNTEAHYLITPYGSLEDKTKITIRGHVAGAPIVGRYGGQSLMVLYFKRKWDDWMAGSKTQYYRWWAGNALISPIVNGPFEMTANLSDVWGSVMGGQSSDHAEQFAAAIKRAGFVGVTFGSRGDGYGHGIKSDAPATITITSFEIT